MIKVPVAGRVKTRLAHQIGVSAATNFYRHTLHILLRRLTGSPLWTTVVALTPDPVAQTRCVPCNLLQLPQGKGNLGHRLQRIFDRFAPNPILIIGSDIPSICFEDITQAFRQLSGKTAVLGPSQDGGYWLIGLRACPRSRDIFNSVVWSSPGAFNTTLRNLSKKKVGLLQSLKDIDDHSDYLSEIKCIGRNILSPFVKTQLRSD